MHVTRVGRAIRFSSRLRKRFALAPFPKTPFADLLVAFRQDQTVTRYATMDDVLGYCHYSANPVGRLVLYACGEVSEENFHLSDATCTALQLANFWQDVRVDFAKGRVYIPQNDLRRFGVSEEPIAQGVATPEFRKLLRHEVEYARALFEQGLPLIGRVDRELAVDLDLFSRGGLEILRAIEIQQLRCAERAPGHLKENEAGARAARAGRQAAAVLTPPFAVSRKGRLSEEVPSAGLELAHAYQVCCGIAKREAKNFYYAFLALPSERRNAICAVYAFMRQADDLADDESLPREERRRQLERWLAAWHAADAGAASSDPVFVAVRDAITRFNIPLELLDELVAGVAMDLDRAQSGAPDTYATFGDLYRYCYLVASVVGLVCIRIFGYRDARAEKLAEETGIAFQLTNILRDVAEDAARLRVYLPLESLGAHKISLHSLLHRKPGAPPTMNERNLLEEMARRAEGYYASARELMPLIDPKSRPALWVLVTIYHGLLKRIRAADYDVFTKRANVPFVQKLAILGAGLAWTGWVRLFGR